MKNSRQCHRQRAAQLNALALKEKRFYRERLKVWLTLESVGDPPVIDYDVSLHRAGLKCCSGRNPDARGAGVLSEGKTLCQ